MNGRLSISFLFPLVCLAGCNVVATPTTQTTTGTTTPVTPANSSAIDGNWQIQQTSTATGNTITFPPTGIYLVGALQGSDSALTGTFNNYYSTGVNPAVSSYSGTYDSSTGTLDLSLASGSESVDLTVPSAPNTVASGSIITSCGTPVAGTAECTWSAKLPAVGVEVAPLNGTYTGTLSGTLTTTAQPTPSAVSGTASLVLTQSTTPNSSGQFPLTGTITITWISDAVNGLSATNTLSGTISGIGITLSTTGPIPAGGPVFTIAGYTNPTATQFTVTNLNFSEVMADDTNITVSGTFTLQ
jgi:hypothetical protein